MAKRLIITNLKRGVLNGGFPDFDLMNTAKPDPLLFESGDLGCQTRLKPLIMAIALETK